MCILEHAHHSMQPQNLLGPSTGTNTSSGTITGNKPSKDTKWSTTTTSMLHAQHKTLWIIIGTTIGASIMVTCASFLLVYILIAFFSVKYYRERKRHPNLLQYDNLPTDETTKNEEEDLDVDELTELMSEQPPSYKDLEKTAKEIDLEKTREKVDLSFPPL